MLRARAGTAAVLIPYTMYAATGAIGGCGGIGTGLRLCVDGEAALWFAGDDLPDGHAAMQLQVVMGVGFDVL
jgi:hypothetical protein